jgi:HicB-like protein involved in pilus formation
MQIDGYVQALQQDLARVAAVGDESTARAAELLSVALESALGRRLLEALGEAALELNAQLDDGRIEVRVAGGDPELVLVHDEAEALVESADEAFTARITLRLPRSLKERLDAAAAQAGLSVNTWLVQALQRQVEPRPSGGSSGGSRRRLTGYGRS